MRDRIQEPTARWSRLLGRWFPALSMRADWDIRARNDAQKYIDCGHAGDDRTFWESGRWDLDHRVLHGIELPAQARALEIGCGTGRLLRPLSERVQWAYGVDISGEMVKRCQQILADRPNVTVFATRGRLAPIADASLDLVYSFIVFQHIPSKKAVDLYMREASRVLKGGGVFRFQVDGRPRHENPRLDTWLGVWYGAEEIARVLDRSGFDVVSSWGEETHYFLVTARRRTAAGLPESSAVRPRPQLWNLEALADLLDRIGAGREEAEAIVSGRKSLRQLAGRLLETRGAMSPEELVRRSYRVLLGREADEDGLSFYTKEIAGGVSPANMIDCLVSSAEIEDFLRPTTD